MAPSGEGRFDGKVLLATGGGSGLAAATAERFTREGGKVAVLDLDGDRAAEVAGRLDGAIALQCDVAHEGSARRSVHEAHEHFGRLDCLVNAAGHAGFSPLAEWSLDTWNRMLAVHATGTFMVCREAAPLMAAHGGGSIVNISSVAAVRGQKGNAAYGAAKGAILSFSQQIAYELAPAIRVNTVAPARIRTALTDRAYVEIGGGDYERGAAAVAEASLLKRIGEPEEAAGPICFLLSDDASFVTGAFLTIDGGATLL
jgi:3-oxoacyl-[acyl-carrier protein] reductase